MNNLIDSKISALFMAAVLCSLLCFSPQAGFGQQIKAVDSESFFKDYLHLLEDSSAIVIDGRTEKMFSEECLGNAINIDADDPDLEELLQPFLEQPIIVLYCTTDRRTTKIKETLKKMYNGEIIYISDGIRGWKKNGFPVNGKTETEVLPTTRFLPDTLAVPSFGNGAESP